MIQGQVNGQCEAIVRLTVRGPSGASLDLDALVDSGCSASLTLPAATAAALGLVRQFTSSAILADGSTQQFDVYAAEVKWDGNWRPILVLGVGNEVLVGMQLLAGHEFRVAVVPGGAVEIEPLP